MNPRDVSAKQILDAYASAEAITRIEEFMSGCDVTFTKRSTTEFDIPLHVDGAVACMFVHPESGKVLCMRDMAGDVDMAVAETFTSGQQALRAFQARCVIRLVKDVVGSMCGASNVMVPAFRNGSAKVVATHGDTSIDIEISNVGCNVLVNGHTADVLGECGRTNLRRVIAEAFIGAMQERRV